MSLLSLFFFMRASYKSPRHQNPRPLVHLISRDYSTALVVFADIHPDVCPLFFVRAALLTAAVTLPLAPESKAVTVQIASWLMHSDSLSVTRFAADMKFENDYSVPGGSHPMHA